MYTYVLEQGHQCVQWIVPCRLGAGPRSAAVVDEVETDLLLLVWDLVHWQDFGGMDDRCVEAGLHRLAEKD